MVRNTKADRESKDKETRGEHLISLEDMWSKKENRSSSIWTC